MTTAELNALLKDELDKLPEPRPARTPKGLMKAKPVRGLKTKVLGVRMEISLFAKVVRAAENAGVTPSEYMVYMADQNLNRKR
jgi:hypothetical protein